ncbi:homeobox KN domain-containing protein [Circinella umbellata]|nr:homeobox KN domain-containing protein [Circinella umbellata]
MLESNGKMWTDILRNTNNDDNEDATSSRSSSPSIYNNQQQHYRLRSPSFPLTPGSNEINDSHGKMPSNNKGKRDCYFGAMTTTATTPTVIDDSNSSSSSGSSSSNMSISSDEDNHHIQQFRYHHEDPQRHCSTTLQDFAKQEPSHDLSHHAAITAVCDESATANRKRRGNLPKPVTAILKSWLVEHCANPYPTEDEKNWLKHKTGLTLNQISNWFINARRRILPLILIKATSADGRPLEHHRKRRGKPPSAMTAARRRMAKRQSQKSSDGDDVKEFSSAAKRGYKRSSNTAFESPRPTKSKRISVVI